MKTRFKKDAKFEVEFEEMGTATTAKIYVDESRRPFYYCLFVTKEKCIARVNKIIETFFNTKDQIDEGDSL